MSQKYFMINEVATLHNMTRKTLHHYDKIGLFSPEFTDEKTGYRYYKREQFPYLKEIIYLKDLGFNLKEIKYLLEYRDFEILIEALKGRLEDVDENIKQMMNTRNDLLFLIDHYETVKHLDERDLYQPSVRIFPERIICYQEADQESNEGVMLAYRKILRSLSERNLLTQMAYGSVYFPDKVGAFISLPVSLNLKNETVLAEGKYITMYKKGSYFDEASRLYLKKWLADKGYEIDGPFIDFSLIDYTFTQNEEEMIQELQIKVK
ncbi:MAG TPA: MerR family transcriptional regulator [Erysipelothrix sp.]